MNVTDQGTLITDQKRRTSNDLFIDHYSLIFERSAGANGMIYCGYPDNNRVSTDIGTGLNDPETKLYYVRNRTYNPVLGRWIQRDLIGLSDGLNFYQYVKDRAQVLIDASGLAAYNIIGTDPGKPMLINAGPVVDLGQIKGKCYAYRDWSYRQHVGVFVSAGESNPDIAKIYNLAQWLLTEISKINPKNWARC